MLKSIAITTQEILSLAFGLLPLLLFLFRKNKKIAVGVIFIYVLGSFLSDSLLIYDFYEVDFIENKPWLRGFTLFEVVFFSVYFFLILKQKWFRIFVIISFAAFLFAFLQHWRSQDRQFDSIPASIGAIICILFSLIYLYHTASNPASAGKGFINSRFWFAIGILIYMAGNLFMFLTYNSFTKQDAIKLADIIFPLMNIVKNIFFSMGMWQKEDEKRPMV